MLPFRTVSGNHTSLGTGGPNTRCHLHQTQPPAPLVTKPSCTSQFHRTGRPDVPVTCPILACTPVHVLLAVPPAAE